MVVQKWANEIGNDAVKLIKSAVCSFEGTLKLKKSVQWQIFYWQQPIYRIEFIVSQNFISPKVFVRFVSLPDQQDNINYARKENLFKLMLMILRIIFLSPNTFCGCDFPINKVWAHFMLFTVKFWRRSIIFLEETKSEKISHNFIFSLTFKS